MPSTHNLIAMPTLARAEERWRLTIDNAPVGIALVGLDGRFQRVNQALCRLFGHSKEVLLTLDFQRLTHPDDVVAGLELVNRLVSGELQHFSMRKRYLHADGHTIWADLSTSLIRNSAGKPLHFVSHITDRSAEVAAAERVEQANRELRLLAARLARSNRDLESFALISSHDLQAPLATVRGYLELLKMDYEDQLDDQGLEWLDRAAVAAERMSDQLSSLLEFARATHEDPTPPVSVSLREVAEEIAVDLGRLVSATGGTVEVAGDDPTVVARRSSLRQVLQNLVENSLKYRHPDRPPRTVISVVETGTGWTVEVRDNGGGIAEGFKESVFTMFTRGDQKESGHGIGLAAARRIVDQWGGSIWVEDNPEGGSCFRFTVPR